MKRTLLLVMLALSANVCSYGQEQATPELKQFYLGPSTGFDNPSGLIGATAEWQFIRNFTVRGGVGIGSWGVKPNIGLRYYLDYPQK